MLEIIKEAGTILKDLPDLAIWILIGVLFYKVVIIGSIFGIIKLSIVKLHDAITKEKKPEEKRIVYEVGDHIIEKAMPKFELLIEKMKRNNYGGGYSHSYIHESDIEWALGAMREREAREELEKSEREKKKQERMLKNQRETEETIRKSKLS